jgi:tetratricopeptide (TPR) repeat protein
VETLAAAREAFRRDDLEQAESQYRALLAELPEDAMVLRMLGLLAHRRDDLGAAQALFERALAIRPEFSEAHQELGIVQQRLGQPAAAAASYRRALALKGDLVMARVNLAALLLQQGDTAAAIKLLRAGLRHAPDRFELHNNLGLALMKADRPAAAIVALSKAVALTLRLAVAHLNLARALAEAGRPEEAAERCRRALEIEPDNPEALARLALAERARGNLGEAMPLATRAVSLAPGLAIAQRALALCRQAEGRLGEASHAARKALALDPEAPEAYLDLADILEDSGHRADALALYDAMLLRRPSHAEGLARRTRCLLALGRFTLAWKGIGDANWLGLTGRRRSDAVARWDGRPFPERTLRLTCEPGFGDTLQLIRYAPLAATRGGRVALACPAPLRRLFATLPAIALGEAPADFEATLSDLPRLFATELESIPAAIPYLSADERLVRLWADRLARLPRPRIGLCWRGGSLARYDRRFLPLPLLEEAFEGIEASLVSMQRDAARQQIAASARVFDPKADPAYGAAALEDFADTAALLANLDLLVSVDTANAHLAGALGRPVYLLLPFAADWRWLEGRDDSPWYPSFTLLRQSVPGDWQGVVSRLNSLLHAWRGWFADAPISSPSPPERGRGPG